MKVILKTKLCRIETEVSDSLFSKDFRELNILTDEEPLSGDPLVDHFIKEDNKNRTRTFVFSDCEYSGFGSSFKSVPVFTEKDFYNEIQADNPPLTCAPVANIQSGVAKKYSANSVSNTSVSWQSLVNGYLYTGKIINIGEV